MGKSIGKVRIDQRCLGGRHRKGTHSDEGVDRQGQDCCLPGVAPQKGEETGDGRQYRGDLAEEDTGGSCQGLT